MNTFVILKILATIIVPPASLAIGVLLWLLMRVAGWRRLAAVTLGLAIFQTLILSFPPVSGMLTGRLEAKARQLVAANQPCCYEALVVLGGGIMPASPPYTMEPELTDASDRIWLAARMYHAGAAPKIIVSGGSFIEQQGGLDFAIFGVDWSVPSDATVWWDVWLPSVGALGEANIAIKELVALSIDRRGDSLAP